MTAAASGGVLVVDDDPVVRRVVRAVLEPLGYEVAEACDGEEALRMVEKSTPALVVLDVMMPKVTGVDVVRRLDREIVRVLMLTALDDAETETASREAGADAYLVKPFSPRQLIESIESLLGG